MAWQASRLVCVLSLWVWAATWFRAVFHAPTDPWSWVALVGNAWFAASSTAYIFRPSSTGED
jgi:hypothetical protein